MSDLKINIFSQLKKLLAEYENRDTLFEKSCTLSKYELYSNKKVKVGKKEANELYFASAMIQKNFVGFYCFPVYTHPCKITHIPPELKKCLKGKSCFHIKREDILLFNQIKEILQNVYQVYKVEGWL